MRISDWSSDVCSSDLKQALVIEKHYQRPMDIEWAKDGVSGKLFIVQARPETVKSRAKATQIERFQLEKRGDVVVEGRAIGQKIGSGVARVVRTLDDMNRVQPGDVLVRSEEHTSELQSLMRISYAVFCLTKN